MHEMSIVTGLLDAVRQETQSYAGKQVLTVRVRFGSLRLIIPEIMQTCYAAATKDTPLASSNLVLEEIPARARCRQCSAEFPVEENWFQCPKCQTPGSDILTGNELDLVGIELADKLS
jgi:hydrogenase nickel incorporation protein HypA/HybF